MVASLILCFASPVIAGEPQRDEAVVESLLRLEDEGAEWVRRDTSIRESVDRYLQTHQGQQEFLDVVSQLQLTRHTDGLVRFLDPGVDSSLAVQAIGLLIEHGQSERLQTLLQKNDDAAVVIADGLGLVGGIEAREMLQALVVSSNATPAVKIAATHALGRGTAGQQFLLELVKADKLPRECQFAATNSLIGSSNEKIRVEAKQHLQPASTVSGEELPSIAELVLRRGDGKAGKAIFYGKGTCSKCHKVHGEGNEVGPDLSEIGSKLSRDAMYVAILNPNAGISHNYEQYSLLTVDGLVLSGLLVNQNENEITLKTAEGIVRTFAQDDVEEFKQSTTSLMPENLHQSMSVQELLDWSTI